jgi:hypothetical protein
MRAEERLLSAASIAIAIGSIGNSLLLSIGRMGTSHESLMRWHFGPVDIYLALGLFPLL